MSVPYQDPNRPRSPEWIAGLAWWRSLSDQRRLSLRREGLTSCSRIVGYHARGGR
jgi:hypothetical protein